MQTVNKTQHIIYDENKNEIVNYFETSADQVNTDDGTNLQTKVGAINGITDSLTATSSNIALSANAGNNLQGQIDTLNSDLAHLIAYGNDPNAIIKFKFYEKLSVPVVSGQITAVSVGEDIKPINSRIIAMFFSPHSTAIKALMWWYPGNETIYTYNDGYTGNMSYDVIMIYA